MIELLKNNNREMSLFHWQAYPFKDCVFSCLDDRIGSSDA